MGALIYFLVMFGPLLLAGVAIALLAFPRSRPLVPRVGLLIVVSGTFAAFSTSAALAERGSIGFGGGFLMTMAFGLLGPVIVLPSLRLTSSWFLFPPVAVGAGAIYVASFYGYLPPWWARGFDLGVLVWLAPGFVLIALGAVLSWRYGLLGNRQALAVERPPDGDRAILDER